MELPGIVTLTPDNPDLARLAHVGGVSFLEEWWTITLLDGVTKDPDRRLEISEAIIANDLRFATPHKGAYALEDGSALAIAYLKSDLAGVPWGGIEENALQTVIDDTLTSEERPLFEKRLEAMAPISVFDWQMDYAQEMGESDYIHFACLAVDKASRGTGAFRRLITPFLDYADSHHIPCFIETYCDRLEGLYEHFNFKVAERRRDPQFEVYERCMVRFKG